MKTLLLNISLVAAAAALFKRLAPEKTFSKQLSFLTACFFISAIIYLISGTSVDFSDVSAVFGKIGNASGYSDFSDSADSARKYEIAKEVSAVVTKALSDEGITAEKIYVVVNISDSRSISITEIKLVLPEVGGELSERAVKIAEDTVGGGITVTAEERRQ